MELKYVDMDTIKWKENILAYLDNRIRIFYPLLFMNLKI
jgi:hypothetical protein